MTREEKTFFARRINQGNKSDIIVVLYDIYVTYESDAISALNRADAEGFIDAIHHMNEVIEHLKKALNFDYDISKNLFSLYDYVQRQIAKSIYSLDSAYIKEASAVMSELREAFIQVAKEDDSVSTMQNSQHISAGMTYGKYDLVEYVDSYSNRGFLA